MPMHATPVVYETNEDEKDNHDDLDHGKPIFGFAYCNVSSGYLFSFICIYSQMGITRTIYAHMDELQQEYWYNENECVLPWRYSCVPILEVRLEVNRLRVRLQTHLEDYCSRGEFTR